MARSAGARREQVTAAITRLAALNPGPPVSDDPYGLARLLVRSLDAARAVDKADVALTVRALCEHYGALRGGRTVELRVPPYAAVQLAAEGEVGSTHTRGTPPNVVETDPETFLRLATGALTWAEARTHHRVRTSGVHADLATLFAR